MPNTEEFLAEHTFKQPGVETWRRVAETLTQDPSNAGKRTAKLLGLLIERLEQKELLDISEVDEMLLEIV